MVIAIILISRFLVPKPIPSPVPVAVQLPMTFTHPDVVRQGRMFEIRATAVKSSNGKVNYNISFKWTGSGGSQHGSQGAIITFKGANGASLQSVPITINREHCYYGGGNLQTREGELTFDPTLISGIDVTLSEVSGTEGAC